ncbi:potassium transporter TrkG [Synechococcus sp. CCY9201]|uniref:TrkH family potassium uptake protein n=1 Tax=unclassified Synechococcus TaxID=2626047 RepID=UPI0018CD6614|nr:MULTISPECIES: potassium transporter TrkG [unclassified Synechococcus]MEA5421978.1 potassium transporter TrkG [Synechococcus sp. CCY9202]MEA5472892.1 potassium transporter TrkG [Synechococcus sp. CCY9201]QPN68000.1 potassium transporter TrkG [Synechococcus sp. CBW1006]CAK6690048.1 Ktr system potassium uptake protein B [Synechococcus sp. CBW1107]
MAPRPKRPPGHRYRWHQRLSVPQFTAITGLLVIAFGTFILASPLCSTKTVGLWEALFTVTSAITVTGLSVIDVGTELTPIGQVALAGLIITGGLGLMAITTFLQGFVQGHSGLRHRLDKGRALDEFGVGGIGPTFRSILITAGCVMGIGTLILFSFGFNDIPNLGERLWASMFHCISAYNNAGFGLWSDSLVRYRSNPVVNLVIASMIVMGGLGWRVTNDLWVNRFRLRRLNRLSMHTRLVIRSTIGLILVGTIGLLLTEHLDTEGLLMQKLDTLDKLQVSLFQSITTRTAGFNTIPLTTSTLSDAGLLLMMGLMFIGASPGGTGGGIKTTTFAALMAATRSTLRAEDGVVVRNREIPAKVVLRAVGVTLASLLFVLGMALLLALDNIGGGGSAETEAFTFLEKLFTCVSAFSTVGLDVDVTVHLDRWGQAVLMVGMYVGRLGILLLLSAFYGSRPQTRVKYPKEELYI